MHDLIIVSTNSFTSHLKNKNVETIELLKKTKEFKLNPS